MTSETIALFQKGVLLVVVLSAPTLIVAVIVGVLVSLVQTLVQIQDQTLPFAIKLIAVGMSLMATGGWVGGEIINFTNAIFLQMQHVGH
jgi:type III secretion protein S